jgi:hypothetical protein
MVWETSNGYTSSWYLSEWGGKEWSNGSWEAKTNGTNEKKVQCIVKWFLGYVIGVIA